MIPNIEEDDELHKFDTQVLNADDLQDWARTTRVSFVNLFKEPSATLAAMAKLAAEQAQSGGGSNQTSWDNSSSSNMQSDNSNGQTGNNFGYFSSGQNQSGFNPIDQTLSVLDTSKNKETPIVYKNSVSQLNKKLFDPKRKRVKASPEEKAEFEAKVKYMKDLLFIESNKYSAYERVSRKWATIFKVSSIFFASAVTVLLGINVSGEINWWFNMIALVLSALVSVIGALLSFFDATELEAKYWDTFSKLEQLSDTVEYLELAGDYVSVEDIDLVKMHFDAIIEDTTIFEAQMKEDSEKKGSK